MAAESTAPNATPRIAARRVIGPVLVAVWLSGCALWGPNYEKPDARPPADWRSHDQYTLIGADKIPEMAWWGKFKDPLLNKLVDRALENNNNIQAAIGSIYRARAILQQVLMNWIPTLDVGAGLAAADIVNPSTGARLSTPNGFTAGLIPNYSLNILQQLRDQEQADANIAASVAAKNAVRLAVISQMAGSYFGLREEQYRLELQSNLVKSLETLLARHTEGYHEGLISLYTWQQYSIDLARARAEVPIIEYNIVNLSNTIHVLLNENPGKIEDGKKLMEFESKGIISGNIPSDVLKNRPDVNQAEAAVMKSNANIGVNTAVFFPTIKLTSPLGYGSGALNNLFGNKETYWEYQSGISMPVLKLGTFGAIKAAKGQYYADFFTYVETVKNAFAAVDSGLASHQRSTESLDQLLDMYNGTEKKYEFQKIRYQEGLSNLPDVLTLNVTLNQAGIMVAQSKLNQLMSIVKLYQEMGGGYKYRNNETARDLGDGHRFNDLF